MYGMWGPGMNEGVSAETRAEYTNHITGPGQAVWKENQRSSKHSAQ